MVDYSCCYSTTIVGSSDLYFPGNSTVYLYTVLRFTMVMKSDKKDLSGGQKKIRFEATVGRVCIQIIITTVLLLILDHFSIYFITPKAPIERTFPTEVVRSPQPYTMFGGVGGGSLKGQLHSNKDTEEKLNRLGYRGKAPLAKKAEGEHRVFVLGGSTVFNGEPTISELLEKEFYEGGSENVNVFNYGVVSSVSGQEVARIVYEISEYEPDLVIMYNGGNDIWQPLTYDPRPGYPFNFLAYEKNPLLESRVEDYPQMAMFLYGSNLMRKYLKSYFEDNFIQLEQTRAEVEYGSDQWREEIAVTYTRNVVRASKVSKAFGAEFVCFLQPMVFFKDDLTGEQVEIKEPLNGHCLKVREIVIEKMAAEMEKDGAVKFVDLTDCFDDRPEMIYGDHIHISQEAKELVASKIYGYLKSDF